MSDRTPKPERRFQHDREEIAEAYKADPNAGASPNVSIAFPAWTALTKVGEPTPRPPAPKVEPVEVKVAEPEVPLAQVWGRGANR